MGNPKFLVTVAFLVSVVGCDGESDGNGGSENGSGGDSGSVGGTGGTSGQSTAGSDSIDNGDVTHSPMTDCAGGKYDPDNDICWQDPPDETVRMPEEGIAYCDSLDLAGHSDWRMPTIEELRSLYRSGDDSECYTVEWSIHWDQTPKGYCAASANCIERSCRDELCNPEDCGTDKENDLLELNPTGPGAHGCYWDPALSGKCEKARYMSSTQVEHPSINIFWLVSFSRNDDDYAYGIVAYTSDLPSQYARCMRKGK